MFRSKTVFVVGAGGSKSLGLPVGADLKDKIAGKLDLRFDSIGNLTAGDCKIYDAIRHWVRTASGSSGDYRPYVISARALSRAMPLAISIDNYINTHYADICTVFVGKLAIVSSILEAEAQSKIFQSPQTQNSIDPRVLAGQWHNAFCRILTEGVSVSNVDDIFENVSFITFNYDRCIESYVAMWLQIYFGLSEVEAQNLTCRLKIVHPYGRVDYLPWENCRSGRQGLPFGSDVHASLLGTAVDNIKTFTEQVDDAGGLGEMRQLLGEARRIVFLGFAFGEMNMKLLEAKSIEGDVDIYGTRMGVSEPEFMIVKAAIEKALGIEGRYRAIELLDGDCTSFFDKYSRVLSS